MESKSLFVFILLLTVLLIRIAFFMRLLHPPQVSGEIMNLLDKARHHVVIVSPYNKIKNWHKLVPYLRRLLERGLPVDYYVRKEHTHPTGVHEVREAGFDPIEIEGLHCKFYLNETYGIVTSMNLLISSDVNSLEIGYVTETVQEYEDLVRFLDENIRSRVPLPLCRRRGTVRLLFRLREQRRRRPLCWRKWPRRCQV